MLFSSADECHTVAEVRGERKCTLSNPDPNMVAVRFMSSGSFVSCFAVSANGHVSYLPA